VLKKRKKFRKAIDEKMLEERKVFLWGMVDDDFLQNCN